MYVAFKRAFMKRNFVELIEKRCSTQKSIVQFKRLVVDIKNVELESTTMDQDVGLEKPSDCGGSPKDYPLWFTGFQRSGQHRVRLTLEK
jgi:hypothetical protein